MPRFLPLLFLSILTAVSISSLAKPAPSATDDKKNTVYEKYLRSQKQSIIYFEKIVKIRAERLGPEHSLLAEIYSRLGNAYNFTGQYVKAINNHQQALKILLKTHER